jgi:hypothetical protein
MLIVLNKVISTLQDSLDYQDQKIDSQMSILKHVTKNFTQTLEDCGYEEGTLHNIMLKLPKTNSELAIKNQSSVF